MIKEFLPHLTQKTFAALLSSFVENLEASLAPIVDPFVHSIFLENLRHQKDILRLTDLYVFQLFVGNKNLNCFNEKFLTVCDTLFPFLSSKYKE